MRALVVINPSSRDFEAQRLWPEMKARLERAADLTVIETTPDDRETKRRVSAALQSGADRLIAIGGDGTVHLSVNAIMEARADVDLAIIPFGTANDVGKSYNLPLKDPNALAEIAAGSSLGFLDVAELETGADGAARRCYWIDSVTIGMDADVLAARGRYRDLGGYLAYAAAMAERALQQSSLDARVVIDGRPIDARVFNVILKNVLIYAGELEMPEARSDDGLLDVYLFNRREYTSKLITFAVGKADLLGLGVDQLLDDLTENQRSLHGRSVQIRLASPRNVQVDGEVFGDANEVRASIAGRLRIAVP